MRSVGPTLALHDVRDVHGHVRSLLDAWLRQRPARLDPVKKEEAVSYLVEECWRISGLQADGRTPRFVYGAQLAVSYRQPLWSSLSGITDGFELELGPWVRREKAVEIGEARAIEIRADGHLVVTTIVERRPASAYDPTRGLSFSTYSRRTLTRWIVDWYRATFGDNRYGDHRIPVSLDQLVDQMRARRDDGAGGDTYLDTSGPGSREEFIDELNRHAYRNYNEEAETDAVAV